MAQRNPGRLAIHRRSEEIDFLKNRLRALDSTLTTTPLVDSVAAARTAGGDAQANSFSVERLIARRERDLADELLHTRQIEPLGETLQRRLAMAERVCRDLAARNDPVRPSPPDRFAAQRQPSESKTAPAEQSECIDDPRSIAPWDELSEVYRVAIIEQRALARMLEQWWTWLRMP